MTTPRPSAGWEADLPRPGTPPQVEEVRLPFCDRREAGRVLATALSHYAGRDGTIVLALPRGGVPVGYEVARRLSVSLDAFVVRKLGVPGHRELAMGAIASGGIVVLDDEVVRTWQVSDREVWETIRRESEELERRERSYRGDRPAPAVMGCTVILVDDGLATGASMRSAIRALRQQHPGRIVVAVPIASADTCREIAAEADEVICPFTPQPFFAVGQWYEDFSETSDEEVRRLLEGAKGA